MLTNNLVVDTESIKTEYKPSKVIKPIKRVSKDTDYIDVPLTFRRKSANGMHYKLSHDYKDALIKVEDKLRQASHKHIVIKCKHLALADKVIKMSKKFAVNHQVKVHKAKDKIIIKFDKDLAVIKSPLDYAGSKDNEIDKLTKQLPKHISNFVDCCGGAFNVGQNIVPMNKVYYNDNNEMVANIVKMLLTANKTKLIKKIKAIINKYHLNSNQKSYYKKFRSYYNSIPFIQRPSILLYVLSLYSFSHMIRFNSHGNFNTSMGKYHFNQNSINRILTYHSKAPVGKIMAKDFTQIPIDKFDKDTLFYFDPPYIITSANYNDGKRFKAQWTKKDEQNLLDKMDKINHNGQKFMLSNVLKHRGKTNYQLIKWIRERHYNCKTIGITGKKYRRVEVVVKNY